MADAAPHQFLAAHTMSIHVKDGEVDPLAAVALMVQVEGRGPNGGLESRDGRIYHGQDVHEQGTKQKGLDHVQT